MRLIDADSLKDFFFSETSGTEDIINDLMMKHNLDYANDVDENEVMDFAKDLLLSVRNVIDTESTVDHDKQIRDAVIEEFAKVMKDLVYKWFESGVINVSNIDKIAEKLKGEQNERNTD